MTSAPRSRAPAYKYGAASFIAYLLLCGSTATDAKPSEPNNVVHWSDQQRIDKFEKLLCDKMIKAGIDPILINEALRFPTLRPPLPPLIEDRRSPSDRVRARPSVAQQLAWRHRLTLIASELRAAFPESFQPGLRLPNPESLAMTRDIPDAIFNQNTDLVIRMTLARLPDLATHGLAEHGTNLSAAPGDAGNIAPPAGYGDFIKWHGIARIAGTPSPKLNEEIRAALIRIKQRFPAAPIDVTSFPAPIESSGIRFIGAHALASSSSGDWLSPLGSLLTAFPHLDRRLNIVRTNVGSGYNTIPEEDGSYRHYYFSRPFTIDQSIPSLVITGPSNDIKLGICVYDDSGSVDVSDHNTRSNSLDSCLLGTLGAYYSQYPGDKAQTNNEVTSGLYQSLGYIYQDAAGDK